MAPVIELGVGFQPDFTARENVLLNGLMLGLTRREASQRFDAVIDFAELREFVDLKLKNYSSGMRVRLAFAIVMQTDPDVVLFDEVWPWATRLSSSDVRRRSRSFAPGGRRRWSWSVKALVRSSVTAIVPCS